MAGLELGAARTGIVAKICAYNSTLTCLHLSRKTIEDTAGVELARILFTNKTMRKLELEFNKRTDTDKYDRRKRVGTSRLSDVWSLGCLFYELLTGEMLFDADEYAWFFVRLTKT